MIVEALRRATSDAHARVEKRFAGLLSPAPTMEEYRAFLTAMYSFHAAIEPSLASLPRPPIDRVHALRDDLLRLELALPVLCDVPALGSHPRTLGAAYVIDGSMLGAKVLHRHLSRHLDAPLSFLAAGAEHAIGTWRALVPLLEAGNDDTIASAVETFEVLDRHLSVQECAAPPPASPA